VGVDFFMFDGVTIVFGVALVFGSVSFWNVRVCDGFYVRCCCCLCGFSVFL